MRAIMCFVHATRPSSLALARSSGAIDLAILDELPSASSDGKLVERLLELRPRYRSFSARACRSKLLR